MHLLGSLRKPEAPEGAKTDALGNAAGQAIASFR
jgi:hypothetical protein